MMIAPTIPQQKHLALELATVSETTARAVMPWSSKGDKENADQVAVECLRRELNNLDYAFRVVVGEGAKDNAPMLYEGETLGRRTYAPNDAAQYCYDLLIDPLECTTNFAKGLPDSLIVLLAATPGSILAVPGTYMEQILVPPSLRELLLSDDGLDTPVADFLTEAAYLLHIDISELCVVVQDRPRHAQLIQEIRAVGAGVALIESGSISHVVQILEAARAGHNGRLHLLWGSYGAPEGSIAAFLAQCYGAGFIGRIRAHNTHSAQETDKLQLNGKCLQAADLIAPQSVLLLSGVHSSTWLPGVEQRYIGGQKYQNQKRVHRVHTACFQQNKYQIYVHENGELQDTIAYHIP